MMQDSDSSTTVAIFADRAAAGAAIAALRRAGYEHTWLGVTATVDENSFGGAGGTVGAGRERVVAADPLARWLHHENERTLYDVLRDHGVLEEDARAIDGSVVEGSCVLVIEQVRDPAQVERIVRDSGGTLRARAVDRPAVADPLQGARSEAARRHPVSGELDINDVRREREPLGTVPSVREELFVRRRLPSSDEPAPY
jgi:hypothetical protein